MSIFIIISAICIASIIGLIAWVERKIRLLDKQLAVLRARVNRYV